MKNISVVLLVVLSLVFAGFAEAAKPKKRTKSANRVGAYGVGFFGQSTYTGDHSGNEADLIDTLENAGDAFQNLTGSTDDSDIGYNATFGYRFNRYFSAELGLVQFGSVESVARGGVDFGDGGGFRDTILKLSFTAGGPMVSAIGYLPLNDKFEFFGRVGYMFTSSDRELTSSVDGQRGAFGSAKGDSQDLVLGVGAAFHFNQVYSARLEYQKLDGVGQSDRSGTEDISVVGLGFVVRF